MQILMHWWHWWHGVIWGLDLGWFSFPAGAQVLVPLGITSITVNNGSLARWWWCWCDATSAFYDFWSEHDDWGNPSSIPWMFASEQSLGHHFFNRCWTPSKKTHLPPPKRTVRAFRSSFKGEVAVCVSWPGEGRPSFFMRKALCNKNRWNQMQTKDKLSCFS